MTAVMGRELFPGLRVKFSTVEIPTTPAFSVERERVTLPLFGISYGFGEIRKGGWELPLLLSGWKGSK